MLRAFFLLLGLALFAALVMDLGIGAIASMLLRLGWNFLVVCGIYGLYELVRAAALLRCLVTDRALAFSDVLWIRLSGEAVQFLSFTGPFLAEPTKAWLLKRRGLNTGEAFAAVIAEYLLYTFLSAALSIAGLVYLIRRFELGAALAATAEVVLWGMVVFLLVAIVAITFRIYLIGGVIKAVSRIPLIRQRIRPDMRAVHQMEDLLLVVLRDDPLRMVSVVAIETLAQGLLVFELYWILRALELATPIVYPFLIETATKFTSVAFFFIPTQMGAAEGTYAVLFNVLALPAAAGFTLAFVRRARSLMVAGAGLGALSIAGRERRVRDQGAA